MQLIIGRNPYLVDMFRHVVQFHYEARSRRGCGSPLLIIPNNEFSRGFFFEKVKLKGGEKLNA